MQFVTCNCDKCGLNENRECRAISLRVDEDGLCLTIGSETVKSPVQNYVEVDECLNEGCDSWEEDEGTGKGRCGMEEPLHFVMVGERPTCSVYFKQVGQPPWSARVVF